MIAFDLDLTLGVPFGNHSAIQLRRAGASRIIATLADLPHQALATKEVAS